MSKIKKFIKLRNALRFAGRCWDVRFNNPQYSDDFSCDAEDCHMPYYAVDASDGEGEYDDCVDVMRQLNQAKKNRRRAFLAIFGIRSK